MDNKLYPNLGPFYKSGSVEYGSELQLDVSCGASADQKLYHKETQIHDSLQHSKKDELTTLPITPSAPPPSEGGRSLLESLHSLIMEGLEPPPYSPKDPLSDELSWIDDLQPDYDISFEDDEEEAQQIDYLTQFANGIGHSEEPEHNVHTDNAETKTVCHSKVQSTNHGQRSRDMVIVRNRQLETSDGGQTHGGQTYGNNEYGAWVTWRKNVNRQLATVILLRRGGHVHLQKSDLSRRPLSRTSMNYVINNAKNNNSKKGNALSTSLNGTPYIMYGIPRVVLDKSPPKRN